MTRPAWSAPLGVLTRLLRWLGLSVLAGLITAAGAATLLTLTWLVVEGVGALTNVPYAWLGVFALLVAVGLPTMVLFGLMVAPLASLTGRGVWPWLICAGGGGALVLLTTDVRFALFGVVGGLVYARLDVRRPATST